MEGPVSDASILALACFFLEGALLFEGHALPKIRSPYFFWMVSPYPNILGWVGGDVRFCGVFGVI